MHKQNQVNEVISKLVTCSGKLVGFKVAMETPFKNTSALHLINKWTSGRCLNHALLLYSRSRDGGSESLSVHAI